MALHRAVSAREVRGSGLPGRFSGQPPYRTLTLQSTTPSRLVITGHRSCVLPESRLFRSHCPSSFRPGILIRIPFRFPTETSQELACWVRQGEFRGLRHIWKRRAGIWDLAPPNSGRAPGFLMMAPTYHVSELKISQGERRKADG